MTHPGFLLIIQDLERQLRLPLPNAVRRVKVRHLDREIKKARRAGYSDKAIDEARSRGRMVNP